MMVVVDGWMGVAGGLDGGRRRMGWWWRLRSGGGERWVCRVCVRRREKSNGVPKQLATGEAEDNDNSQPYEALVSHHPMRRFHMIAMAFREDGNTLAAGTTTGQVVFYDVHAKEKPLTVLRVYANSE
ncbi:hypothetical protein Tco_1322518, partial [Tanacetum coccineum]